jgi:hypothetical protein
VRPADSKQDRYTAINGKGWRNWGLTVKEQAERYVKYLRTGEEPERTLPIEPSEESVLLEVTDRGRYVVHAASSHDHTPAARAQEHAVTAAATSR